MTDQTDTRPLFTIKTLAEYLDLSDRQVRALIAGPEPQIRSFAISDGPKARRRILPAEVDRYIAARQDAAPNDEEGSSGEQ